MKAQITIKQQNPDYNQQYADEYNLGEESVSNKKYNWSMTLGIPGNVIDFTIQDQISIPVTENCSIPNMTVITYNLEDGRQSIFAFSKSLIDKKHEAANTKYDTTHYYIYLKNTNDYYTMNNKLYVAAADLPEELIPHFAK